MPVIISISSLNGSVRTFTVPDGQGLPAISLAAGERLEIIDQDSPGVGLVPDGDDVALRWTGGNDAVSFRNLALALVAGDSKITVVDRDSGTTTVIASLEELFAGFSTAAGGAADAGGAARAFGNVGSIDEHGLEGSIGDPQDLGPPMTFGPLRDLGGGSLVLQSEFGPAAEFGPSADDVVAVENNRPQIGALKGHRSVTEIADGAAGENVAALTTGGSIAFGDVDPGDTHTVTVLPEGSGYLGNLTATLADDSTGDGVGSVAWHFSVDDAAVDHLAAGETLIQRYVVRVADGDGGVANKMVEITIHGTNDEPVIGPLSGSRTVSELPDGAPGEGTAALTTGGSIAFGDVDLGDVHGVTVVPQGSGYLGSLTATVADDSTGDGTGSVAWSFSVDDAAVDHLGACETLTQRYVVEVADGHGGVATKTVEITIEGARDGQAPVFLASLFANGNDGNQSGDALYGGSGDDILTGGAGGDVLFGGRGNDILTGSGGNDLFVVGRDDLGDGAQLFTDTITDFEAGDTLDLRDVVDFFAHDTAALQLIAVGQDVAVYAQETAQTIVVIENQAAGNLSLDQNGNVIANS